MKILNLKGCNWLNQQVRNDFFGYRRYEALAKHIKPFFKKTFNWKDSVPGLNQFSVLICASNHSNESQSKRIQNQCSFLLFYILIHYFHFCIYLVFQCWTLNLITELQLGSKKISWNCKRMEKLKRASGWVRSLRLTCANVHTQKK